MEETDLKFDENVNKHYLSTCTVKKANSIIEFYFHRNLFQNDSVSKRICLLPPLSSTHRKIHYLFVREVLWRDDLMRKLSNFLESPSRERFNFWLENDIQQNILVGAKLIKESSIQLRRDWELGWSFLRKNYGRRNYVNCSVKSH